MRKLICIAAALAAGWLVAAQEDEFRARLSETSAPNVSSERVDLTILQSTDIHGSPAVARFLPWITAERQKEPELLLVDCGDLCNGTFETYCDGGASMVSCLNAAKYDVWVPGNHEFRIGNANFRKDLSLFTNGSVLAANLVFDDPVRKPSVPVLPWKMFERKGLKIAVIGMASHRYDDWFDAALYKGLRLLSPVDTFRELLPQVRAAKPDVIVVAAHSDLLAVAETKTGNDEWIPSKNVYVKYPDIALLLAGHSHRKVPATEYAPGQWIVQPADNGGSMAKVVVTFDTMARKVVTVKSEFAESKTLEALPEAEMPKPWRENNARAAKLAKTPVVRIPKEGLPATFVAEAIRKAAGADAAITSSAYRIKPNTDEVTAKFFYQAAKPQGITVLTLTPAELKTVLDEQGKLDGRFSGLDLANLPDRPVKVAFEAYDIAGCDGERMKLRAIARSGVPRQDLDLNTREVIRSALTVAAPLAGCGCDDFSL